MRVLVLSDTHIPTAGPDLPGAVYEAAQQADAIVHAGDFVIARVLDDLEALGKPVYAVHGNMDESELVARLPEVCVAELAGFRVAIYHGEGAPEGLPQRVLEKLKPEKPQVIVFGHSHHALVEWREGILLLNPGSPLDRRWAPYRSFAWLRLAGSEPEAEIVRL